MPHASRGRAAADRWLRQPNRAPREPPLNPRFQWRETGDGGRRYWLDVQGHHGWRARYLKEVDAGEQTVRFWQEVYDDAGKLVEIHEKYPVDQGHRKV